MDLTSSCASLWTYYHLFYKYMHCKSQNKYVIIHTNTHEADEACLLRLQHENKHYRCFSLDHNHSNLLSKLLINYIMTNPHR